MTRLMTGGAGHIRCHVVRTLHAGGTQVIVLDDLSTGKPNGCLPLTASRPARSSTSRYVKENVEGLRMLPDRCDRAGVRSFLFSSNGAVHGPNGSRAVHEDAACVPASRYGQLGWSAKHSVSDMVSSARHAATVSMS